MSRLRNLEVDVLDAVAATVPWLAPAPTAYIAYTHLVGDLALPTWVAVAGALVVEGLGLSVVHTSLSFWRADGLRSWRLWLAIGAGVFYLAIVASINILLDDGAGVEVAAKAMLSFTSIPAALILALRAQDRQRKAAAGIELERAAQELRLRSVEAERHAAEQREDQIRAESTAAAERRLRLELAHQFKLAKLEAGRNDGATGALPDAPVAQHGSAPVAPSLRPSRHDATLMPLVAQGLQPSEIERITGINRGSVSRWMRRRVPGAETLARVNGVHKEIA